ncbi:MAG: type IV pilus twitching motility protein PilT [Candidatus Rokubacteria bacterium]|nr:type IV pilus twitching motility protein PilT [Candidatus Rokubacteria bacterium]
MAANLQELLAVMVQRGASDLHLSCGTYPQIRLNGNLEPLEEFEVLMPPDTQRLVYSVLTEDQQRRFEQDNELDLSFGVEGLARFRCNVYRQRGALCAAMRVIPYKVRTFAELQLPPIVEKLAEKHRGLVLVTGPTGSGKSTTLAAVIDKINSERRVHIVTIEDPIEFVHQHKKSLVHQREIASDTHSFTSALKSILRQDPDVVLLGEMRDLETVAAALTIAETGHLTFGTLHTNSCAQTINRIIDVFPTAQQSQIRAQLSLVIEGVLSQTLLPTVDGRGRAMALEIMLPTPAIRNLIREEKVHQIYSMLQAGSKVGMQTMSQSLAELVRAGKVSKEEALARAPLPDELLALLGGAGAGTPPAGNAYATGLGGARR